MYNPYDWYWLADDGRVFASANQSLVPKSYPAYKNWLANGNVPTRWPCDDSGAQTDSELSKVLKPYGLTIGSFEEIKSMLKAEVDSAAEIERLKYITPGNGQAMTYQQKVTEAQAFKATTNPQDMDYPMLSSEVGITAEAISEVADVVLAAFAHWQQIGAMIESIRLGAKRDIDAAEDEAAARAVVDSVEWPQPAL
ncbi:hypothetical protein [Brucella anthropi]|uniref:DUF4376 domain-containing protein n=1 Tax=Brucella anthropi TaxID=529 RepID=A0A6L3Z4Y7_BRUAN|nr:hypothetical protein [Brucella anthropi]KAB2768632.1 hypothetical protein F9L04_13230 [Brucella anthropi]